MIPRPVLLLLLPILCQAAPLAAQTVNCADPYTQSEINACAEQDWKSADVLLNRSYKAAMATMRAMDRGLPDDLAGAEAALRAAQRSWIQFRDDACAAEGFAMRGGSGEPMLIYFCLARLTTQRSLDLDLLAQTP